MRFDGLREKAGPRGPLAWLIAAAILIAVAPADPLRSDVEVQKVTAVNALAEAGFFVLENEGEGRKVVLSPDFADPQPARSLIAALKLERDMASAEHWLTENGRLLDQTRVTAFARDYATPTLFKETELWRGEVAYANTSEATAIPLVDILSGGTLNLREGANISNLRGNAEAASVDVAAVSGLNREAAVFELLCLGAKVARVHRVGDELVLTANPDAPCVVSIADRRIGNQAVCSDLGIKAGQCNFAPVRLGDQVVVQYPAKDGKTRLAAAFQRQRIPRDRLIMRRDARARKIMEAPEFATIVERLALDVKEPLRGCDPKTARLNLKCDDDITLTIDEGLQREVAGALALARKTTRPRHAAVVMNALTGDLRAIGGAFEGNGDCPHPALCPFPFGSVGKPIFAAAMIAGAKDPGLASLEVQLRPGGFGDVLGLALGSSTGNLNGRSKNGRVDLETFLTFSDNYYIAAMGLLASANPEGRKCALPGDQRYWLGNQPLSARQQSFFETAQCQPLADTALLPEFRPEWADRLQTMFDLNAYSPETAPDDLCETEGHYGTGNFDATPFRALLRPRVSGCIFHQSGALRQYFRVNQQVDFRKEMIALLLGGGEARMSAVKLAEAYSRIVTGTRVSANLVQMRSGRAERLARFDARGDKARIAVSRGLAGVIDGTASSTRLPGVLGTLRSRLPRDYRLGAFAKTGTIGLDPSYLAECGGCDGKAFAVTVAVYRHRADKTGNDGGPPPLVTSADAKPLCAVTIAVILAQPTGASANEAADIAAEILSGSVGRRLVPEKGKSCGRI